MKYLIEPTINLLNCTDSSNCSCHFEECYQAIFFESNSDFSRINLKEIINTSCFLLGCSPGGRALEE
ncbi:MAG: hypothetical protein LBV08_07705 [Clostridiales bacterium]|jgi:hypothetical protein|nr:hypothetical protein [Clostridiales bacterium]